MTWALRIAFVLICLSANGALVVWSRVPVGFGLMAPAGVYLIGLSFTVRDLIHDRVGSTGTFWTILAAVAVSMAVSTRFAMAGGVALCLSETCDLFVYEPLRSRGRRMQAIALSNLVGLTVDSALFLWLAFGSLDMMLGQVLGKVWATLAVLPFVAVIHAPTRVRS